MHDVVFVMIVCINFHAQIITTHMHRLYACMIMSSCMEAINIKGKTVTLNAIQHTEQACLLTNYIQLGKIEHVWGKQSTAGENRAWLAWGK